VRTFDAIALPDMMDFMDPAVIGEHAVRAVLQQRAVIPGSFPKLVDDIQILIRPLVAFVMCSQASRPKLRAAFSCVLVTIFQATRPLLI